MAFGLKASLMIFLIIAIICFEVESAKKIKVTTKTPCKMVKTTWKINLCKDAMKKLVLTNKDRHVNYEKQAVLHEINYEKTISKQCVGFAVYVNDEEKCTINACQWKNSRRPSKIDGPCFGHAAKFLAPQKVADEEIFDEE